jgi:signal transduction histidine kinase
MRNDVLQYLTFIGIPALLLGGCGLLLLHGEVGRLEESSRRASEVLAGQMAGEVRDFIHDAQAELIARVQAIPADGALETLLALSEEHPFARNAFLWRRGEGAIWPEAASATAEERSFLARYALLFSGGVPWEVPREANGDADGAGAAQVYSTWNPRKIALSRRRAEPPAETLRCGWTPWFEGNQLFLLGWCTDDDFRTVRGVEMETMALLSHLPALFEATQARGCAYAVADGATELVGFGPRADGEPVEVSLAPALPHWTLRMWRGRDSAAGAGGFVALGALMLAVLMASVFGGGALLMRDARRQRRDALQKTSFVSNVSHELKTPLTSIRMYAELLQEKRVDDPARAEKFLGIIVSESKRLSRLVSNVLDFSRLEQGRKRYSPERIRLDAAVRDVVESMKEALAAYGLEVMCAAEASGIEAVVDRDALSQVLVNLLDNAGKYAASGGAAEVRVLRGAEGAAEIRVFDRGPGIAPEKAKRIFDKFYRADDATTSSAGGCGLGLGLARLLMRGQGGDVRWEPREGGGSCFVVTLPGEGRG